MPDPATSIPEILEQIKAKFEKDRASFGWPTAIDRLASSLSDLDLDDSAISKLPQIADLGREGPDTVAEEKIHSLFEDLKLKALIAAFKTDKIGKIDLNSVADVVWGRIWNAFWKSPFLLIPGFLLLAALAVALGGAANIWGINVDASTQINDKIAELEKDVSAQQEKIIEFGDEAREGLTSKQEEAISQIQNQADLINAEFSTFKNEIADLKGRVEREILGVRKEVLETALANLQGDLEKIRKDLLSAKEQGTASLNLEIDRLRRQLQPLTSSVQRSERRAAQSAQTVGDSARQAQEDAKRISDARTPAVTAANEAGGAAEEAKRNSVESIRAVAAIRAAERNAIEGSARAVAAAMRAETAAESAKSAQAETADAHAATGAAAGKAKADAELIGAVAGEAVKAREAMSSAMADVVRARAIATTAAADSSTAKDVASSAAAEAAKGKERIIGLVDDVSTARAEAAVNLQVIAETRSSTGASAAVITNHKETAAAAARDAARVAEVARVAVMGVFVPSVAPELLYSKSLEQSPPAEHVQPEQPAAKAVPTVKGNP